MSKVSNTVRIIVEYTWLIIACISVFTVVVSARKNGFMHKDTLSFIVIGIISCMMFFFRRNQRLKK